MLLFFYSLLFAQAGIVSNPPLVSEEMQTAVKSYSTCLRKEVFSLQPSGADFDDIFEAAKTACSAESVSALLATQRNFEGLPPSSTGNSPEVIAWQFLNSQVEMEKSRLRLDILRFRALRGR